MDDSEMVGGDCTNQDLEYTLAGTGSEMFWRTRRTARYTSSIASCLERGSGFDRISSKIKQSFPSQDHKRDMSW